MVMCIPIYIVVWLQNGLVAGDTFREVRVRHQDDVVGNVIEGTYEVMKESIE